MNSTVTAFVHSLTQQLAHSYPLPEAISIAWELIIFVTHKGKTELLKKYTVLSAEEQTRIHELVAQHLEKQVPIAYLTGTVQFGLLNLALRPPILIPRPETEAWCYRLIELLQPFKDTPLRILDLCTGSGCIALALAHALPHATVVGVDINPNAVTLAQENSTLLRLTNCSWILSDLFEKIGDMTFDIITANPPYISLAERETLASSVRHFESPQALFAADDGYAIIKKIILGAPPHIRHNDAFAQQQIPHLFMEIGHTQAKTVEAFMHAHNYATIQTWKDYQGHDRVICARVPPCTSQRTQHIP